MAISNILWLPWLLIYQISYKQACVLALYVCVCVGGGLVGQMYLIIL